MSNGVVLTYQISKEAYKAVKAGTAILSSGGVRTPAGTILELARPVMTSVATGNPGLGAVQIVSSLGNNVQSIFIQKGINSANRKLDFIQKTIGSVNSFNWLNCALGMVNCGISVAGFKITLEKLKETAEQIKGIADKIDQEIIQDKKRLFNQFRLYIKTDMDILTRFSLTDIECVSIEQHFAEIISYLTELIERFEAHEIDGVLGCNFIFSLSIAFCQEVKEYSAQYYYKNGKMPPNYEEWIAVLDKINSPAFKEILKELLIFETDLSMEEKYMALSGIKYAIEEKLQQLDYTKELVQRLTFDQYRNQEAILLENMNSGNVYETDDSVYIAITS